MQKVAPPSVAIGVSGRRSPAVHSHGDAPDTAHESARCAEHTRAGSTWSIRQRHVELAPSVEYGATGSRGPRAPALIAGPQAVRQRTLGFADFQHFKRRSVAE
jgi:hypothetical protein